MPLLNPAQRSTSPGASSGNPQAPPGQPLPSPTERGPDAVPRGAFERLLAPRQDKSDWINVLLRLLVGGAFVFAGVLKIMDPSKFALDIANYRLVPHGATHIVAILLPWIEVVAGSFILAGVWLRAAALVITSLTLVFFVVIVSALARGLNIECGCFGTVGGRHVGLVNLAIDSTLLLLAAILAKRSKADPVRINFREAGAQNTATPLKASPRTS